MFKQTLAAALLSTALIANAAAPVFANESGDDSHLWAEPKVTVHKPSGGTKTVKRDGDKGTKIVHRNPKGKVTKVERLPKPGTFASVRNPDGSTTTVRRNSDGSKTIINRNADGKVTGRQRIPAANPPAGGAPKAPKPRGTSWAHNHTTGVTSVGVGGGVHIVFGPFGISLGGR